MKLLSGAEIQCPLSVLQRVRIFFFFFFFFEKIYENFVGTLRTVRNREMSLLERCPYDCNKNATKLTGGIM